jgi:ParB-like chromosome segregation protein Spo0J
MNEIARSVITVDPDFATIWGDLDGEAYEGLKAEIKADGIRDPLVIWNPNNDFILVDGHNRLKVAAELHMTAVPVSYKVFKGKAEAAEWIVNHQSSRRNISDWQKYKAIEAFQKILREKAKEHQSKYHGNRYDGGLLENSPKGQTSITVRKETAKAGNLSEWKVRQGDYIQKNATEEQKAALDSGKKTMKEVFNETKKANTPTKAERLKQAEQLAEATKPEDGKVTSIGQVKVHKEAEQRLLEEKASAAYDTIYNIIRESRKLTDEMIDSYKQIYSEKDNHYFINARSIWDAGQKLMKLGEWTQEVSD